MIQCLLDNTLDFPKSIILYTLLKTMSKGDIFHMENQETKNSRALRCQISNVEHVLKHTPSSIFENQSLYNPLLNNIQYHGEYTVNIKDNIPVFTCRYINIYNLRHFAGTII